jgi:hypothetical protein
MVRARAKIIILNAIQTFALQSFLAYAIMMLFKYLHQYNFYLNINTLCKVKSSWPLKMILY